MNPNIIFVGGIHGIGKTTLCKKISDVFDMPHYAASDLINKIQNVDYSLNKRTEQIQKNQDMLLNAITMFIPSESHCLLDGHFCLLDNTGRIKNVSISTFKNMSPIAFVVLKDHSERISSRLRERDGQEYDHGFISSFQNQELQHSKMVAQHLAIPILQANPFTDLKLITEFIQKQLKKCH